MQNDLKCVNLLSKLGKMLGWPHKKFGTKINMGIKKGEFYADFKLVDMTTINSPRNRAIDYLNFEFFLFLLSF